MSISANYLYLTDVFRLMKNIIFNKTESFRWRNTSSHACQIFCSKSNCETMYHWFFLLEITVAKIMNNLNVCSAHSYLYPRSRFNWPSPISVNYLPLTDHQLFSLIHDHCLYLLLVLSPTIHIKPHRVSFIENYCKIVL